MHWAEQKDPRDSKVLDPNSKFPKNVSAKDFFERLEKVNKKIARIV